MNPKPVAQTVGTYAECDDEPAQPFRWSPERKVELVLRLLKGEPLADLTDSVPAEELEKWRHVFLESGTRALKTAVDPDDPYGRLRSVVARRQGR